MGSRRSMKRKLLEMTDDMELVLKNALHAVVSEKTSPTGLPDVCTLTQMYIDLQKKFNDALNNCQKIAEIGQIVNKLNNENATLDAYLKRLHLQLKEAEELLAVAIFHAKKKLALIDRANENPVSVEDLIRYAHKISSVESVCAPLTWQPGDPRRPYPTEMDMRASLFARFGDPPGNLLPPVSAFPSISSPRSNQTSGPDTPSSSISNPFSWHPSGDIHLNVSSQSSVPIKTNRNRDADDVEVMSTDSSSSSSSDSQ